MPQSAASDRKLLVPLERTLPIPSEVALLLGALAIAYMQLSCVAAAQPSKRSKTKGKTVVQSLLCSPPNLKFTRSSVATFSAHTVTLSWGASVPSPTHASAEGYCLYRSKTQGDAKLGKNCKECELLSKKPISGTTCIDKSVADDQIYYYAVAGVNAAGMSGASNEASASIRKDKPATSPPQDVPSCSGMNPAEERKTTTEK